MNPNRVDFLVDLAYGVLLFLSIVLIVTVGTVAGIMFGLGALVSYVIHVVWKMSRFDPDWMSREVAETVGEQVTEEVAENVEEQVTETVGEQVTEEVTESVGEQVTEEVAENVEEQVTEEVAENVEEQVTESVEAQVSETVEEQVSETVEETLADEIEAIIAQLEAVSERVDRRPHAEAVEDPVGGAAEGNETGRPNAGSEREQHEG